MVPLLYCWASYGAGTSETMKYDGRVQLKKPMNAFKDIAQKFIIVNNYLNIRRPNCRIAAIQNDPPGMCGCMFNLVV